MAARSTVERLSPVSTKTFPIVPLTPGTALRGAWINDLQGDRLESGVNTGSPGRPLVDRALARLVGQLKGKTSSPFLPHLNLASRLIASRWWHGKNIAGDLLAAGHAVHRKGQRSIVGVGKGKAGGADWGQGNIFVTPGAG